MHSSSKAVPLISQSFAFLAPLIVVYKGTTINDIQHGQHHCVIVSTFLHLQTINSEVTSTRSSIADASCNATNIVWCVFLCNWDTSHCMPYCNLRYRYGWDIHYLPFVAFSLVHYIPFLIKRKLKEFFELLDSKISMQQICTNYKTGRAEVCIAFLSNCSRMKFVFSSISGFSCLRSSSVSIQRK